MTQTRSHANTTNVRQRSISHVVIDGGAVVFEGRSLGEGLAFIEGRGRGVLCKVLSGASSFGDRQSQAQIAKPNKTRAQRVGQ